MTTQSIGFHITIWIYAILSSRVGAPTAIGRIKRAFKRVPIGLRAFATVCSRRTGYWANCGTSAFDT